MGFSYISIFVLAADDCQIGLICPAVKRFSRSLFAFFSVNTLFKVTVEVPPPVRNAYFFLFLQSLTLEGCVNVHFLCAEFKSPRISTLCDITNSSGQVLYILTNKAAQGGNFPHNSTALAPRECCQINQGGILRIMNLQCGFSLKS